MLQEVLPYEERTALGATHRIRVFHTDLTQTTANTTQVVNLLEIPAGALVRNVFTRTTAKFADASDEDFNTTAVTIGDGTTANLYVTSTELNTNAATPVRFKAGTGTQKAYDAAGALNVTFASMAAKALANLDSGELEVFVELIDASTYDGGIK
ncbi:MAG: hypothetical protein ACFUZC_04955 [Chthoniobacteraceae bacterium]